MSSTLWLIVLGGALSIVYGILTTRSLLAADAGTARMQEISAAVREGAQAYLKRQYATIGIVGVVIFIIAFLLLGWLVVAFAVAWTLQGVAACITVRWARPAGLALAILDVVNLALFPLSTALGLYALVVYGKAETRELFRRRGGPRR